MDNTDYNKLEKMVDKIKESKLREGGSGILIKDIRAYILSLEEESTKIKEKIKELEHEIETIKKTSVHILTETEKERIAEFGESHFEDCYNMKLALLVLPAGDSNVIAIKCIACQTEEQIADKEK